MKKLITGYRVGDIVGEEYRCIGHDEEEVTYLIDGSDIENPSDLCNKCMYHQEFIYDNEDSHCLNYDQHGNYDCKKRKYYYTSRKAGHKDAFITLDIRKLSESCRDFCIHYGKNCYNTEKSLCILRLIEKCKVK